MATITYRFTTEERDDGTYVTTYLDEHAICTHGPMPPRMVGPFIEDARRWAGEAFERILTDLRSRLNRTVEDPQWPPELVRRMTRENHEPTPSRRLPPYVR